LFMFEVRSIRAKANGKDQDRALPRIETQVKIPTAYRQFPLNGSELSTFAVVSRSGRDKPSMSPPTLFAARKERAESPRSDLYCRHVVKLAGGSRVGLFFSTESIIERRFKSMDGWVSSEVPGWWGF
jgi:hypothetical protein